MPRAACTRLWTASRVTTDRGPGARAMKRRDFFKIVTTSGAAAAVAGGQQLAARVLPPVVPNEQIVPGGAAWFSNAIPQRPAGCCGIPPNPAGRVVQLDG